MCLGKVLIIEDDEMCATYFEDLFLIGGYGVAVCEDGFHGIMACSQETPDVILIDIKMPYISGQETLKIIKKEFPKIPVIMMTAYASTEIALECGQLGAEALIRKPGDVGKIIEIVDACILRSKNKIEVLQELVGF